MLKQSRKALTHLAKRYRAVLRRCRLLALACAFIALPPLPAGAVNSGGVDDGRGNYIGSDSGSGGHVIIDSGFLGAVYGGHIETPGEEAKDNTVRVTNGTVTGNVIGGYAVDGKAHDNEVRVSGGTVTGDIYGGLVNNSGSATYNTVIIAGAPHLEASTIYGGSGFDALNVVVGDNRLIVQTSGLTAKNIVNFEDYVFQLPATFRVDQPALTLTDSPTDMSNGKFSLAMRGMSGAGRALAVGDRVAILYNGNGIDSTNLTITTPNLANVQRGVSMTHDFEILTDATGIYAQVTDTRLNPQTKALPEGHLGGTALTLQGADLAAGKGMEAAGQAVRASPAAGGKGLAAFGALSGGWSRYNTGSHIDVSGFSLLTGLAWGADSVLGQFTAGMFFEYGSAASTTFNSFSNAASVSGDGSTWYMGGGLLARMDFNDCGPGTSMPKPRAARAH